MSELNIQYRSEHSRSVADAELYQAIETLTELGQFSKLTDVDTWHGRVTEGVPDEPWSVDPAFMNGGNDSGNKNINGRPTLYTATKEIADDFARYRGYDKAEGAVLTSIKENIAKEDPRAYRERWGDGQLAKVPAGPWTTDEISREGIRRFYSMPKDELKAAKRAELAKLRQHRHQIISSDPDAVVLNSSFKSRQLGPDDKARYQDAITKILIPVSEGSPVSFAERDVPQAALIDLNDKLREKFDLQNGNARLNSDDVQAVSKKYGVDSVTLTALAGSLNARMLIRSNMSRAMVMVEEHPQALIAEPGRESDEVINLDYIARTMRAAHVVGTTKTVRSGTIGRVVEITSLIDLPKVNTRKQYEIARERDMDRFGALSSSLEAALPTDQSPFSRVISNPYAKPHELVEAAMNIPGWRDVFESKVGNWEGYSLQEHTETVLRNIEENFADHLPSPILCALRLAALTHDIGKPLAAATGNMEQQANYNAKLESNFLKDAQISPVLSAFVKVMNGPAAELARQIVIKNDVSRKPELDELATRTVGAIIQDSVIKEEIDGFKNLCEIMLTADGGAYTSMAVTRGIGTSALRYMNAGSFDSSFKTPHGPGKRSLKLQHADRLY